MGYVYEAIAAGMIWAYFRRHDDANSNFAGMMGQFFQA
jgi:hypothetical protein